MTDASNKVSGRDFSRDAYKVLAVDEPEGWMSLEPEKATEIDAGVLLTVDPDGGGGLMEIEPGAPAVQVEQGGEIHSIIDVAHVAMGQTIQCGSRRLILMKHLDVAMPRAEGRLEAVRRQRELPGWQEALASFGDKSMKPEAPRRTSRLKVVAATGLAAAIAAFWLQAADGDGSSEPAVPVQGSEAPVQSVEAEASVAPEKLEKVQVASVPVKEAETAAPTPLSPAGSEEDIAAPAMGIKPPEPVQAKTVGKPEPPRAKKSGGQARRAKPQKPASVRLTPEKIAALEAMIEEAVLYGSYDVERARSQLEALKKKIPKGTALRKRLEREIGKL